MRLVKDAVKLEAPDQDFYEVQSVTLRNLRRAFDKDEAWIGLRNEGG